jgi:hypothetical protein
VLPKVTTNAQAFISSWNDVQPVGGEGDEDEGFDAIVDLVKDGT